MNLRDKYNHAIQIAKELHMEGSAQVPQSLRSGQGCLRFRCRHSHQVDRRYGTHEVSSNAVGEEE